MIRSMVAQMKQSYLAMVGVLEREGNKGDSQNIDKSQDQDKV